MIDGPLIPCDPQSPLPSGSSTQSCTLSPTPSYTTDDSSQDEFSEKEAIRLRIASNMILLIASLLKVEMQPM